MSFLIWASHVLLFLLITAAHHIAAFSVSFLLFLRARRACQACLVRMASLELLAPR